MANEFKPVKALTPEQAAKFEPQAKMLAATGIAQSLSYTSERKYLQSISDQSVPFALEVPSTHRIDSPSAPFWLKIEQIGRSVEDDATKSFTAIQKILTSCFMPNKAQLIFLVYGHDGKFSMYLGLRSLDKKEVDASFISSLKNFMEGIWPGIKCDRCSKMEDIKKAIGEDYYSFDAMTGIPSMESQYKTTYPATIDALMQGMRNKNFSYMVIADPVPENEVDGILFQCRDFCGKAESLKSFNFSENMSSSVGQSLSQAHSVTENVTETESESTSRKSAWGMAGAGLLLASAMFPPAGAVTSALAIASNLYKGATLIAGTDFLGHFTPTKTKGYSTAVSKGTSDTTTRGVSYTEQQGKSISQNVVNKHIESVAEHLFYHSKRFETGKALGCWSVGVYLMGENKQDTQSASLQMKSLVSGQESIFEPVRIHHIDELIEPVRDNTLACMYPPTIRVKAIAGEYFSHPLGYRFDDLRTVLTTKELSYFINFPLRSVPGISVVNSCPDFCLNAQDKQEGGIGFGKLINGGTATKIPYSINPAILSRHTLITGINGSGKTNTVQAILNGIKDMPFLVIEPAKTEYVDWALEYNKKHPDEPIAVYIPGCKKYRGTFEPEKLRINPFDIIWLNEEQEPNILAHIDRLKSTFAAAFPMYDILPVLLEDLIYSVYQNKSTNWLGAVPEFGKTKAPTLNSMSVNVEKVIGAHQYEERIGRNMMACLNTRIDSLRRGWKGEMLCCANSTTDKLFKRPVVVNLSYVGDDIDKAFIMALILQRLYEYRQAEAEIGAIDFNSSRCRHLTIIEEAHRVMSKCDNQELPQYKSAMMFSNMLSEIRAYGEGFMLVDQVPTRLIPDAVKNTNLKICHRMVAEDDCKAIGESMSLSKEQRRLIPKLLTGQCIVSSSYETDSYWVKADKVK